MAVLDVLLCIVMNSVFDRNRRISPVDIATALEQYIPKKLMLAFYYQFIIKLPFDLSKPPPPLNSKMRSYNSFLEGYRSPLASRFNRPVNQHLPLPTQDQIDVLSNFAHSYPYPMSNIIMSCICQMVDCVQPIPTKYIPEQSLIYTVVAVYEFGTDEDISALQHILWHFDLAKVAIESHAMLHPFPFKQMLSTKIRLVKPVLIAFLQSGVDLYSGIEYLKTWRGR